MTIILVDTHLILAIIYHVSRITYHVSRITYHVSRITYHVSRITYHVSRITYHKYIMEELNNFKEKPVIEYPCDWAYKVIVHTLDEMNQALRDILHTRRYHLRESHQSKQGKYVSFTLTVVVDSEEDRDGIYRALKMHECIVMVL